MIFLSQFIRFAFARKKYWLVPVFMFFLLIGALLLFAEGSAIAPLIYTIF